MRSKSCVELWGSSTRPLVEFQGHHPSYGCFPLPLMSLPEYRKIIEEEQESTNVARRQLLRSKSEAYASQRENELRQRAISRAQRFRAVPLSQRPPWIPPEPGEWLGTDKLIDTSPADQTSYNELIQGMFTHKSLKPPHWESDKNLGWDSDYLIPGLFSYCAPLSYSEMKAGEEDYFALKNRKKIPKADYRDPLRLAGDWCQPDFEPGYFQKPVYNAIHGGVYQGDFIHHVVSPRRSTDKSKVDFIAGDPDVKRFWHKPPPSRQQKLPNKIDDMFLFWRRGGIKKSKGKASQSALRRQYLEAKRQAEEAAAEQAHQEALKAFIPESIHDEADDQPRSRKLDLRVRRSSRETARSKESRDSSNPKSRDSSLSSRKGKREAPFVKTLVRWVHRSIEENLWVYTDLDMTVKDLLTRLLTALPTLVSTPPGPLGLPGLISDIGHAKEKLYFFLLGGWDEFCDGQGVTVPPQLQMSEVSQWNKNFFGPKTTPILDLCWTFTPPTVLPTLGGRERILEKKSKVDHSKRGGRRAGMQNRK